MRGEEAREQEVVLVGCGAWGEVGPASFVLLSAGVMPPYCSGHAGNSLFNLRNVFTLLPGGCCRPMFPRRARRGLFVWKLFKSCGALVSALDFYWPSDTKSVLFWVLVNVAQADWPPTSPRPSALISLAILGRINGSGGGIAFVQWEHEIHWMHLTFRLPWAFLPSLTLSSITMSTRLWRPAELWLWGVDLLNANYLCWEPRVCVERHHPIGFHLFVSGASAQAPPSHRLLHYASIFA